MGIKWTIQLSYKFRLLLLFALCMMVIGWATSSYLVTAIQEIPKAKIFNRTTIWRKELASSNMTKSKLKKCSLLSPYLRGTSKLIFQSNLTWGEIMTENPKVQKGYYHPEDCKALQRVAILIPHRNREKHLLYLLKHLHPFLQRQQVEYGIYVIHQAGDEKFNRARLLNVGYLEALKEENWDCFIFHDVDLIPENDHNLYMCDVHPKHLVVGRNSTGYRLRYKGYFGGVSALTRDQFYMVNGFSNNYWGWGGEDDDLRIRLEIQGMKISRPPPSIAKYTMIFHTRDKGNEVNSERMKLLKHVSQVWQTDGLNSCSYNLLSVKHNPLYINITVDFLVTS
ncbi:beta-1,4-galactosyltransferase 4 [Dromiciops gliroides]|uniref:beta-1,4-galactosyltransferase 4 n=1 Tax=Dromiciops gliroides TaxID=33562 RepID=UPI001CC5DC1B|nr:beta-1,4-galactosyltransferase 4 [Dromiciops gliroides]XP_043846815.1 beta-1,4-galactosyltransferase 4 [Dromiciops gliroides]